MFYGIKKRTGINKCLSIAAAGALILTLNTSDTRGATATTQLSVSATVLALCVIVATPLAFGIYSSAALDATATITVTCTPTTTYNVGLDPGLGTGATVSSRTMTNTVSTLNYSLFRDSARTNNWGQTVGTDTLSGVGSGLPQVLTVYGRVPANQVVSPGIYGDTVTATITY